MEDSMSGKPVLCTSLGNLDVFINSGSRVTLSGTLTVFRVEYRVNVYLAYREGRWQLANADNADWHHSIYARRQDYRPASSSALDRIRDEVVPDFDEWTIGKDSLFLEAERRSITEQIQFLEATAAGLEEKLVETRLEIAETQEALRRLG